jgi:hypothetical protein
MIDFEDIKLYLPKYLSVESNENLFENLKDFPENIDSRIYNTRILEEHTIYQGDGLEGLLVINFPDTRIDKVKSMVLSNTCDININNIRLYPSSICYSPIINLQKFIKKIEIRKTASREKISQFIQSLKKQRITQIFYLPKGGKLKQDSFIFFDKINSCSNTNIKTSELKNIRLFSLSNYGLYLLLYKLSIHFSRIREGVDRG